MFEYQNILIAPDVFDYITKFYSGDPNIEDIDLKSYKENLRLKCLILDKRDDDEGIYSKVKKIINDSSDLAKNKLEIILDEFIQSNRIKFGTSTSNENFVKSEEHNYLFNLALYSNTKIINSQLDILLYKNRIDKFEIMNIEEFINPPAKSSIFSLSRDILLNRNDKYNIFEELKYYWLNTKSLIVEDDYLRKLDDLENKKEGQFPKLISLIKTCKNIESLIIRTPFSDKNQNSQLYLNQANFEREIKEQTSIQPVVKDLKVGERHYYTDYFKIDLGKGLDFFNISEGYRVWRPIVTIRITPLKDKGII